MLYYNYHKHDHKGNAITLDVICNMEDYCKRAVELGQDKIFTTNHGMQGDIFEATTLAHQYGLQLVVGVEAYYVENRLEKDKSNRHIIIIALNSNGVRQINKAISQANIDGFYYKPRIDKEILMNYFNPNDVVITTACVAGILKNEQLIMDLHNKFKDNFLIEVQDHDDNTQREFNKLALEYSQKYKIKIIHANDSHYIKPEDAKYRTLFLKGKGITYPEENQFILDYPTYNEIVERYKKQGILSDEQIKDALNNTLIFNKAKPLDIINTDIKLPSVSKNPNKELKELVYKGWENDKQFINKKDYNKYLKAIQYELNIVEKTHMEDYFIMDYKIVDLAQKKYNGRLTNTGRGSAPSFYINKLLGLTDIDRLASPITLFPTRFMSAERILRAKSLPDIDLNTTDAEPFIQATKDLLGEENCAWMIAWKPLQASSAFRLYCKAIGMKISEYNEIAKNLEDYKNDAKWKDIIKESEHFIGVIESISESPCSMLLYDKPIAEEVGLIRTTNKLCCLLDGYNCDKYKYLKNDYLTVTVWAIIREVYNQIGKPIPTIREFNKLLDNKTFKIYENGLTCTINQFDGDWATGLAKKYKMKNVSETSAFIASIRPGFASLLNTFIERKPYTTGVKELDNILDDSYHFLLYQESLMKYFVWLGIDEKETYDIIKKISKKKFKEDELKELKDKLQRGWMKVVGRIDGFEKTWQVVQNSARYVFNASHSLSYAYDSLYGAYLKSHYPLEYYSVVFDFYKDDTEKTSKLTKELEYFNISLSNPKYGYSKGKCFYNKANNKIYKGVGSIKNLNVAIGNELYELSKQKNYINFIDLMEDICTKTSCNSRQCDILIKLNFFSEFGKSQKLLDFRNYFNLLYNKQAFKKETIAKKIEDINIINMIKKNSTSTYAKYTKFDYKKCLNDIWNYLPNKDISIKEQIDTQIDMLGYIDYKNPNINKRYVYITDIKAYDTNSYVNTYCLNNGKTCRFKISNKTIRSELSKGDIIYLNACSKRIGSDFMGQDKKGKDIYKKNPDKQEWWIDSYSKINDINKVIENKI